MRAGPPDWSSAATAYDAIAGRYDRVPVENRINGYMRRASLARLTRTFRPGQRVLEVGCGTGDEALALAGLGVQVVAIDPSREMVRAAEAKAASLGLADRVTFRVCSAREISRGAGDEGRPFDGGYASFSLAYEPALAPVSRGLHDQLAPGATFLASVPSRVCLVEFGIALVSGRLGLAGNRLRDWHPHKVGDRVVPIRTYTPQGLSRAMAPHFSLEGFEALPVIVPPPYLNRAYARTDGLAEGLERVDAVLRRRFPFRYFGDHILAELRHVPSRT